MVQEFNRSRVRELTNEIQKSLDELGSRLGIQISLGSTTFSSDKFTTKITARPQSKEGVIMVSDCSHDRADHLANMNGVSFSTHIIGSVWKISGDAYKVEEINTKRPKYPVSLINLETNGRCKATWNMLKVGKELVAPNVVAWTTWLLTDPDSDAVMERDVEIFDAVEEYFNLRYSAEELDFFYEPVNELDAMGKLTEERCKELYNEFKENGLRDAAIVAGALVELDKALSSVSKKRSRK